MTTDYIAINHWIGQGIRILDLGCGDGSLLAHLIETRNICGYGLEIDPTSIHTCISKGLNVIEQDVNSGLHNFSDNAFDSVIMTQALQVMRHPHLVLDEMLRIGRECIITFPNFGHWRTRGDLGFRGRMPVTEQLAYQWYDTPNIHFFTYSDFEALCCQRNIRILHRQCISQGVIDRCLQNVWPNLFTETAIYHLSR